VSDINEKLRAAFQVEHIEHLEGIRACLIHWGDATAPADVDEAFRRAHSLKGAARVTGFSSVESLAHQLESLFAQLQCEELQPTEDVVRRVEVALDAIEDCAACLLDNRTPPDVRVAVQQLEQIVARPGGAEEARRRAAETCDAPGPLNEYVRIVGATGEGGVSTIPQSAAGDEGLETAAARQPATVTETVRLSAENLDRLLQSTGQLITENMQQDVLSRELRAGFQRLDTLAREWDGLKRAAVRVMRRSEGFAEASDLTRHLTLAEQECNAIARHVRAARTIQQRSRWSIRSLTEQLQDDVRRARLAPAKSEFQSFRKMMRELARDQGKQVEFRITGFETMADRMVLQSLKDPLMHVLRNAVTHGIESPARRIELGKPAGGLVTLEILATGNRLTVRVQDDGGGVDLGTIAAVAVRRGALSAEEAAKLSPADLTGLLFQPGFSTSAVVTELAGRGMGLSATCEAVSRLRGEVHLDQASGAGTVVSFAVPLSISTHQLLLVTFQEQLLAIPFYGIEAVHYIRPAEIVRIEATPMMALSGGLLPLTTLSAFLHGAAPELDLSQDKMPVVVLRTGSKRVAVLVERLNTECEALIKNLGPPADRLDLYLGGIVLEDGTVAPVLNPVSLVERFKPLKQDADSSRKAPPDATPARTVLVVDDSFTTRTLETNILASNGYRVLVAVDGVEALERLCAEKIDAVITDLQMPRLDGFGLLEAMKRDVRLASTPVIVVSSLDSNKDQERGLQLGADAYIVKRRFDHQELLQAVRQIV
jgi:two-component system, chemotaxis family, sensor kinase CheA